MENLKKSPKKISPKNLVMGMLFGTACVAGMFLDSEGKVGWLALGVGLLAAIGCLVVQTKWNEKMEGDENDN